MSKQQWLKWNAKLLLQAETASAREARMKAESLAKAYESRLKEEEVRRAQLQEQILAADAKLQEEICNRMLTVMSRHTEAMTVCISLSVIFALCVYVFANQYLPEALSITAEQLAELENLRRRSIRAAHATELGATLLTDGTRAATNAR